jgi:redox-sensitive bicupin YhaK (pirin superfamily)
MKRQRRWGTDPVTIAGGGQNVCAAVLEEGEAVSHAIRPSRKIWAQIADGSIILNGETLRSGDGAALNGETGVRIKATSHAEILLFAMA